MESQHETAQGTSPDEILFENVYTPTQEMFQEYIKHATRRSYKIIIYTGCTVSALFSLSYFSRVFEEGLQSLFPAILFLCIAALFPVLMTMRQCKSLKLIWKQEKILNSGNAGEARQRRFTFYNDRFTFASGSIFRYSQISKIVSADTFFILWVEKTVAALIKKDAFVKGSCEEFVAFINSKHVMGPPITMKTGC